jgi:hypothetical protein
MALTKAEMRVLQLLPTHLSLGEIGEELYISVNTVKAHLVAIRRKLQADHLDDARREVLGPRHVRVGGELALRLGQLQRAGAEEDSREQSSDDPQDNVHDVELLGGWTTLPGAGSSGGP